MKYKVQGTIKTIGERKELSNGATVLSYTINNVTDNGWETPFSIEMYNKPDRIEHLDNFLKFNNVGDSVVVEFDIKGREYEGRVFNSLSHWSCKKVDNLVAGKVEDMVTPVVETAEAVNDLPF